MFLRVLFLGLAILLTGGMERVEAVTPPASSPIHPVYIVRHGDTVYSIARHYGIKPSVLLAANPAIKHGLLRSGQRLLIPIDRPAVALAAPSPKPVLHPSALTPTTPSPPAPPEAANTPHYLFIVGHVKQLIDSAQVQRGRWRYIVFHHSGTPSGNAKIFDYYHRNVRGMENGLAYHFVIGNGNGSGDGEIEVGGRWLKQLQGGHLHSEALNQISIGVCFVGDFDTVQPSKKQIAAAIELVSYLRDKCGPPTLIFKAHREINPRPTDCPGKLFPVAAFHKLFDN